jgi:hypothetical protein
VVGAAVQLPLERPLNAEATFKRPYEIPANGRFGRAATVQPCSQARRRLAARITLHHSVGSETVPNPLQTGAVAAGCLLHQNQRLKRRAGGEGDCDADAAGTAHGPYDRPATILVSEWRRIAASPSQAGKTRLAPIAATSL